MKFILLLAGFLATLPQVTMATTTVKSLENRDIAIFFSNDVHGETEPCG